MKETNLSQDEIERIFRDSILPQVIGDITPQSLKKAFILGGQPGSGKSTLVIEILKSNKNLVFINGDDLRSYHPNYFFYLKENEKEAADLTQEVCNFWVESLIKESLRRKLSMIIEGTMRTKEVPLSTAKIFKNAGYDTNLVVVSAPYELSMLSLEYRHSELKRLGILARYTKKSSHDEAYKNIEDTLTELSSSNLFNKFFIYLRTAEGFEENIFKPKEREQMLKVFNQGRSRMIEDREIKTVHFDLEIKRQGFLH